MDVKTQKVKLIIFAFVIVAAIVGGIFIVNKNKDAKFQQQLNLGNEALLNLDYEGAVTAFANAIGIDQSAGAAPLHRDTGRISDGEKEIPRHYG